MFESSKKCAAVSALCLLGITACSSEPEVTMDEPDPPAEKTSDLETAEAMIDAFYSFDPARLEAILSQAGDSAAGLLGYQAWLAAAPMSLT